MSKSRRLVLSNSRRGNFTRCFRYAYFDLLGLRPIFVPIYFVIGSFFHNILEDIYSLDRTLTRDDLSDFYGKRLKECRSELVNETMPQELIDKRSKAADEIYDVIHTNYSEFMRQKDRYEFLALEVPIRMGLSKRGNQYFLKYIPLNSPQRPMNEFVQVLDGIAYDRELRRDTVFEHKTTGDLLGGYGPGLKWNFQSIGNTLGARLFLQHHGRPGLNTIFYNVFRKKAPHKPKSIQCKPCKGSGVKKKTPCRVCKGTGIGGMSKTGGETTAILIDQFMEENSFLRDTLWYDNNYQAVRAALLQKSHPYHLGLEKVLIGKKASQFVEDTYSVFQDMRRRSHMVDGWYRHLSPDCKKCGFRHLCFDDNPIMRKSHYHLITEDSEYPYEFQLHSKNFLEGGFCRV